jgi:hypothetical protein
MLLTLLSWIVFIIKLFVGIYLLDLLFNRIPSYFRTLSFYRNQGIPFLKPLIPLFGNFPYMIKNIHN